VAALRAATHLLGFDFCPSYLLYQNIKWRSHFVFLKPLLGLVFDSQKCCHTFVNWYYIAITANLFYSGEIYESNFDDRSR
jgi:hypothetical protein